jgi:hypothetical protein
MNKLTRKRICPACGRKLWRVRDFYSDRVTYCKECERAYKREEYAHNRKVPDGQYYNNRGQLVVHKGTSTKIAWTPQMISDLERWFPKTRNDELADLLGVSPRTMIRKARELNLTKDADWLHHIWDSNRRQAHIFLRIKGYPGSFQKGIHYSPETEFKPGHKKTGGTV